MKWDYIGKWVAWSPEVYHEPSQELSRPASHKNAGPSARSPDSPTLERNKMALQKQLSCQELVSFQWKRRQEDLKDPEYEALSFDYVAPHTFNDQPEGYWRWQFSWGGPSDELRAYVNENDEIHRLEYWYLDWGDGAHVLVHQDAEAWAQMQQLIMCTAPGQTA